MSEVGTAGVLVVDKPAGWTSHQVVGRLRRLLGTRKVGHAGTLDPMATGVLVVGVNRATRLLGYLAGHDKTYEATIRLGQQTMTDDAEGEFLAEVGATAAALDRLPAEIARLTGVISQVPATVSAIKVDGQRAYARSRRGEDVVLKPRTVTVNRFEIVDVREAAAVRVPVVDVDVVVDCSAGTYIRSLARDLGAALGVGGHLTALRRTRVGGFGLAGALTPGELAADPPVRPTLMPMIDVATMAFPVHEVTAAQAAAVRHGTAIEADLVAAGGRTGVPVAVTHVGEFLALYEPAAAGMARAVAVFVG